jgi:2-methylisocitrate lyase-like PEP mutase family enzyme
MPSIAEKRSAFRSLHQTGCFVIPNPWDVGTARYLQQLGFPALATTSSGFAWSQGHFDGGVPRDAMLTHFRELVTATDVPVNADFEAGHAGDPCALGESVSLCVETGVAGLSIEDATGEADKPLYDLAQAVERMRAAREAIDRSDPDVLLVGRAECFLVGRPDLDETIRRLNAYSEAGADCLYAPGIRTREQIDAIVKAVAPKPVNVLISASTGLTVTDLAGLGVRRISVGGALARVAWGAFTRAAKQILTEGRFDLFSEAANHPEINGFFREDQKRRNS